jgi:predicted nucleotidyltransferase component of viral defense system
VTLEANDIQQHAATLGFRPDSLEKVCRLLSLLETLSAHPFLKPRFALKGGTALNLFLFDVPRLSVDIDINYIGAADRDTMLSERPSVEQAIHAVCARERLAVKRSPIDHAGGKWRLSYLNAASARDRLELDVNFMLRTPLWPVSVVDSRALGPFGAKQIAVLDRHELAAGKMAALCARRAGRDLFDTRELLRRTDLSVTKLRLAFVVYGGMNRADWRTLRVEDIEADALELERELIPMLRADVAPSGKDMKEWTSTLRKETRELMSAMLPLAANEHEFIELLNDRAEIVPELLTSDAGLQGIIRDHPGLKWKALKVSRRGRQTGDQESPVDV